MSTETTETTKGTPGGKGPRVYKDKPTHRERVICESLASKVKELTGREVSAETVRAVRWSTSRWYDQVGKDLMQNMDAQLKRAAAQEKFEKAQQALKEAQAELGDVDVDDDDTEEDSFADDDASVDVDDDEDDDEENVEEDMFDDDKKVSASF